MTGMTRFTRLALAALLVTASASATALTANPDGTWLGTVKCDGKFQGSAFSKLSLTIPVTVYVYTDFAVVVNRFGGQGGVPVDYPIFYVGAYFPDTPTATKGTLGFGYYPEAPNPPIPYLETGQAKLEMKKDGSVTLNGKSFVLADSDPYNGAVSASCDWKLNKTSDDAPI
jgi:hypothetical protein